MCVNTRSEEIASHDGHKIFIRDDLYQKEEMLHGEGPMPVFALGPQFANSPFASESDVFKKRKKHLLSIYCPLPHLVKIFKRWFITENLDILKGIKKLIAKNV